MGNYDGGGVIWFLDKAGVGKHGAVHGCGDGGLGRGPVVGGAHGCGDGMWPRRVA